MVKTLVARALVQPATVVPSSDRLDCVASRARHAPARPVEGHLARGQARDALRYGDGAQEPRQAHRQDSVGTAG